MYVRREVLGMPILNPEEGSSSSGSLAEVTWTLVGESSKVAQNGTIKCCTGCESLYFRNKSN